MATRRRLPLAGYGPAQITTPSSGGAAPLPPPPDGTIPNRLPVGMDPHMMQMQGEGGGDDTGADPMQTILRMLQTQGVK